MKKVIFLFAILLMVCQFAIAQDTGSFTIRRPLNGAKVRETIKFVFPKSGVPLGAYVGVYLDGKFLEAVAPTPEDTGDEWVYPFNTVERGVKDGVHQFEMVLYYGMPAIAIERSQVELEVANEDIDPGKPVTLRYKFNQGERLTYKYSEKKVQLSISQEAERRGATATETVLEDVDNKIILDTIRNLNDGTYIVRALPVFPYLQGTVENRSYIPLKYFKPLDLLVTNLGEQKAVMLPHFIGNWNDSVFDFHATEGGSVEGIIVDFLLLSEDEVETGDKWPSSVLIGLGDLSSYESPKDKNIDLLPGTGTLVTYQWLNGYPCAKITFEFSVDNVGAKQDTGTATITDISQSVTGTLWLAYETGKIIKLVLTEEIEGYATSASSSGGMTGSSSMGPGGGTSMTPPGGNIGPPMPGGSMMGPGGSGTPNAPAQTKTDKFRQRTTTTMELIS